MEATIPFNINEFISEIADKGTIKPNKFQVSLILPTCWDNDPNVGFFQGLIRDLGNRVDKIDFPGITHQVVNVRRYGYGSLDNNPLVVNFDDVQMSVILDENADYWRLFHKWMNKISNSDAESGIWNASTEKIPTGPLFPYELSYKVDYAAQVVISWYAEDGTEVKRVILNEAFPSALSPIKLDWGDNQDVARFVVNWTFQDFFIDRDVSA